MNIEASIQEFGKYLDGRGWKERPFQRDTIEKIVGYFDEGKKLVMLNAPTGSGKTLINWAVGMGSDSAYYITGNLSLQDQIIKDELPRVCDIRGRSNYGCRMWGNKYCDEGFCQTHRGFKCEEVCEYKSARQDAVESQVMLSNLMYFALEGGRSFDKRELLVIDEGHNLSEQLIGFSKATISATSSNKDIADKALGWYKTLDDKELFLEYIRSEVFDKLDDLDDKGELGEGELKEYKRLRGLYGRLENCADAGGIIISKQKSWDDKYEWIVVQPLLARGVTEKLIFDRADKVLISSATLNRYILMDELGVTKILGKGKSVYIPVESTFPKERRPLYLKPVCNFSFKNQNVKTEIKMGDAVASIILKHKGEKGIVFCQGYRYLGMLESLHIGLDSIDDADELYRRMMFTFKEDRKQKIKDWIARYDDAVLVGVNVEEGLDLKYDLARFAIIFKAPFADSRDPRVEARLNLKHWNWYFGLAQQTMMQAYGRIMRAEDDFGSLYVLDESACKLLKRKGTSRYVKEAIV